MHYLLPLRTSFHQLPKSMVSSVSSHLLPLRSKQPFPPPNSATTLLHLPTNLVFTCPTRTSQFKCSAGQTGFFTKLGRLIKEKAKSDVEKVFSGFSKTRDNLAVIDELLLYWNLSDTDRVLDNLEEVFALFLYISFLEIQYHFLKFPSKLNFFSYSR